MNSAQVEHSCDKLKFDIGSEDVMEEQLPTERPIIRRWWLWTILIFILGGFVTYASISSHNQSKSKTDRINQVRNQNSQSSRISADLKKKYGIVADFTPPSKAGVNYGGITIVNDYIYIGTSTRIGLDQTASQAIVAIPTNYFYKLDINLKPVWSYEMGKTMIAGGAVLDRKGNIYFVTEDYLEASSAEAKKNKLGLFTELNLMSLTSNGKFRWKKQISKPGGESWHHATVYPAIGTDDCIYVGESKFFAFDTEGKIKWSYPTDSTLISGLRSAPIIDKEGYVYFVSPEPTADGRETDEIMAYKFDANGHLVWSTLLDNQILDPEGPYQGNPPNGGGYKTRELSASPAFSVGEKYFYIPVGNTINKIDTQSGDIAWSMKPEGATGSFKSNPAVDGQDNIYLGTKSNDESTLYAISAEGKVIWKKLIGGDIYPTPVLGDDGKLYVLSEEGIDAGTDTLFRLIDIKTGRSSDALDDKGPIPGGGFSASVIYKGYFYSTSGDLFDGNGELSRVAIAKKKVAAYGYPTDAPWPKGHGRNDNSGRSN